MKPLALLLFLFVGFVGSAFAQIEKSITEWIDLDLPDDEFALQVPKGFEFEKPTVFGNKIAGRGEFHSESERFYIFVDVPKEPSQRKQVEAFLKYANQKASTFGVSGIEASKAEFEDSTGFYHRVIFVETPSRVFTLQTVSQGKNTEAAVRLLNSFRLQLKSVPETTQSQPSFEVNPRADAVLSMETEAPASTQPAGRGGGISSGGDGLGSASGVGIGNGSGSGTAGFPPIPPKVTSPLRITYKQKATYTDFARFYNIQGNVTLRVTFLASGGIGSVTTVRKLPFGLTETATYAARQMKFEPEVANGVARTTTRPVSFTFNIY
ncbi:MAG: energy transducer TonB [Pyrinomonadaceae bacterium]